MKVIKLNNTPIEFKAVKTDGYVQKDENNNNEIPSKPKSNTKKILLSLGALATVGIAGLICLKRGKTPHIRIDEGLPSGKIVKEPQMVMTEEASRIYDDFNSRYNTVINGEWLDKYLFSPDKELTDINEYYRNLERKQQVGASVKTEIKRKLKPSDEIDSQLGEKIDESFASRNMSPEVRGEMQEFYAQMEQEAQIVAEKQAKKEAMLRLKVENPEEYARIRAEQKQIKKAAKSKAKAEILSQNTEIITRVDGVKLKRVTSTDKKGTSIIRLYSLENDKLINEKRISHALDGSIKEVTVTVYDGNRRLTRITQGNIETTKIYMKSKNGKYKLLERSVYDDYAQESKLVRRMPNGNFEIVEENEETITRLIRDKKGKILSKEVYDKTADKTPPPAEPPKILAAWYRAYLDLCKEFGESPRVCGKYGAFDHFYELSLRKNDPEAYESYLRNREYRARLGYNERAVILEALDTPQVMDILNEIKLLFPNADISNILIQINSELAKNGTKSTNVKNYLINFMREVNNGNIKIPDLTSQNMNEEINIGEYIVKELNRLEQEAQALEEMQRMQNLQASRRIILNA